MTRFRIQPGKSERVFFVYDENPTKAVEKFHRLGVPDLVTKGVPIRICEEALSNRVTPILDDRRAPGA